MNSLRSGAADAARPLSDASLPTLPRGISRPGYDRRALRPGVVHLGVGGFHRSHQGVYLDSLADLGVTGWGVLGVGMRSSRIKRALGPQDWLYTVVERDQHSESARVVGAMTDYLLAPDDPEAVLRVLAAPSTKVVTLTVTGNGYFLDEHGELRCDDPEVRADVARPDAPTTMMGFLTRALQRRRAAGLPGFTVLSCDNLPDNGRATRTAVVSFAHLYDDVLAAWIDRHVTFPSSTVDRITPATDDELRRWLEQQYGVIDRWPVATEPFTQWIVEDEFCQERPPLAEVGVRLVADVTPYKQAKARLLNGSHTAMAYLGHLAGHRTTAEVMDDPVLHTYISRLMSHEVAPLLPRVPGQPLEDYRAILLSRLANPRIGDPLSRLCARGSTKMAAYLLPSLAEARSAGHPAPLLTLAVAAWFRYLRGHDLRGVPHEVVDPYADRLQALARSGGSDPGPLVDGGALAGLICDSGLRDELRSAMHDLDVHGPQASIRMRLGHSAQAQGAPRLRRVGRRAGTPTTTATNTGHGGPWHGSPERSGA